MIDGLPWVFSLFVLFWGLFVTLKARANYKKTLAYLQNAKNNAASDVSSKPYESEYARLRRQHADALTMLYKFEEQRDKWKKMFFQHSVEHSNAHNMLEQALSYDRKRLVLALQSIALQRAAQGLPPVKNVQELLVEMKPENPPVGVAAEFTQKMSVLFEKAEQDLEARTERRKLLAAQEPRDAVLELLEQAAELSVAASFEPAFIDALRETIAAASKST